MPVKAIFSWLNWLAHRRRYAFLTLMALLTVSGALLAHSLRQSAIAAVERQDAYEALVGLERLMGTLRDAETGQRGFLLTGNSEYLEPYDSAVAQFGDRMTLVRNYRPFPSERIELLNRQCRDKLAELGATIAMYREGRRAEAVAVVRSDRGKEIMDDVRDTIAGLQRDERGRVEAGEASLGRAMRLSLYGFSVGGFLTASTIAGLIVAYSREERGRKAAEDEIERTASRYSAINRAAPGAIITADAGGVIDEWNPAAEAIFGWTAAEICGQPMTLIVPERHRAGHREGMARAIAAGRPRQPNKTWELEGLRKDGTEFPAELFVDVFSIDGVPHCVGIVRDITPRKHMEAQLAAQRAELQRSNDDLQQFAYAASHDLQEPLRMVDKFVGLLAEKYRGRLDDQADRYIGFAVDGARRMRHLIDDLLCYSRVTTKAAAAEPVDVFAAFEGVVGDLAGLIDREEARVLLATALPPAFGEPFQVRQLLQNLIANGIKFHRPGVPPVVTVACAGAADEAGGRGGSSCWHFTVADNGIGIPSDQRGKLFQLFTRLHAREEYEGTGIGLAICKKIVERHGGRIWIEGEPGEGSTFHFTLPKEYRGQPSAAR